MAGLDCSRSEKAGLKDLDSAGARDQDQKRCVVDKGQGSHSDKWNLKISNITTGLKNCQLVFSGPNNTTAYSPVPTDKRERDTNYSRRSAHPMQPLYVYKYAAN